MANIQNTQNVKQTFDDGVLCGKCLGVMKRITPTFDYLRYECANCRNAVNIRRKVTIKLQEPITVLERIVYLD